MPARKKRDTKDSARKQTLNPPTSNRKPEAETREPTERDMERKIGQFSGEGTPPLQKR